MITLPSWLFASLDTPVRLYWRDLERCEEFTENHKLSAVTRLPNEPESDAVIVARRERQAEAMR